MQLVIALMGRGRQLPLKLAQSGIIPLFDPKQVLLAVCLSAHRLLYFPRFRPAGVRADDLKQLRLRSNTDIITSKNYHL